jgi:hypothetical protein
MRMPRWLEVSLAPLLCLVAVALSAVVYFPLTRVYFISDDFANMLRIVDRGALHFLFEPFGGHMLFVRNGLFILHFEMFGLWAEPYGWITLLTHLLNVVLVFRVGSALTRSPALGAFAGVLWGASHLQNGALGWYSVYGQVVAGTLFLVVLDRVLASPGEEPIRPRAAALWATLLVLGATCFGVGISLALAAPFVIFLLLPSTLRDKKVRAIVASIPVAVIALYFVSRWVFFLFEPIPASEAMTFQLAFSKLGPNVVMFGYLMAIGASGLLHGFAIPQELFQPAPPPDAVLVSVYAAVVVAALALGKGETRRRIAALLVASAAVYGLIALGRANTYLMWDTPPSVSARTGRYHYVGTIPLALALAVAVGEARRLVRVPWLVDGVALVGWAGYLAWSYATSTWHVDERKESRATVEETLEDFQVRARAAPPGADLLIPNTPLPPHVTAFMGYEGVPGPAALFALTHSTDLLLGHRVRFVAPAEYRTLFADPKNERLSKLIVPGP